MVAHDAADIAQLPVLNFLAERECNFASVFTKEESSRKLLEHLGVGVGALLVSVEVVLNADGFCTLVHFLFLLIDLRLCDVLYETGDKNSL